MSIGAGGRSPVETDAPDLAEVLRLVDTLTPAEQIRVFEHLAQRLDRALDRDPAAGSDEESAAWVRFLEAGERVATGWTSPETSTELLSKMRR
jgi:hypothetical protein